MKYIVSVLLYIITVSCTPHIIYRQNSLSSDYTYVCFPENKTVVELTGFVGGEHTSYIKLLGFKGELYSIEFPETDDEVYCTVDSSDKVSIKKAKNKTFVLVEDIDAFIVISASAHPDGNYKLKIRKHKLAKIP